MDINLNYLSYKHFSRERFPQQDSRIDLQEANSRILPTRILKRINTHT